VKAERYDFEQLYEVTKVVTRNLNKARIRPGWIRMAIHGDAQVS
jgi:hypothetical protein